MGKLALAVEESILLPGADIVLRLDRRTADAAWKRGGGEVLLYQLVPRSFVRFLASGRVAGFSYEQAGHRDRVLCRIEAVRPFTTPVIAVDDAALPRALAMLDISDERFAQIIAGAEISELRAEEVVPGFVDIKVYEAVNQQVLRRWDHRCAVTGEQYPGATGVVGPLRVVPIRPRELGGPLHARNYLPMVRPAADAWGHGNISATRNFEITVVERRVDVDLLERMRPSRTLLVPDDPAVGPDPEHLAYHRTHVFGS